MRTLALSLAAAIGFLAADAWAQANGTQFQVNTYTTGDQYGPSVAARSAGDFVVVWQSGDFYGPDQDGSSGAAAC